MLITNIDRDILEVLNVFKTQDSVKIAINFGIRRYSTIMRVSNV